MDGFMVKYLVLIVGDTHKENAEIVLETKIGLEQDDAIAYAEKRINVYSELGGFETLSYQIYPFQPSSVIMRDIFIGKAPQLV
jgi:hypothetical protein